MSMSDAAIITSTEAETPATTCTDDIVAMPSLARCINLPVKVQATRNLYEEQTKSCTTWSCMHDERCCTSHPPTTPLKPVRFGGGGGELVVMVVLHMKSWLSPDKWICKSITFFCLSVYIYLLSLFLSFSFVLSISLPIFIFSSTVLIDISFLPLSLSSLLSVYNIPT
jgi:hypothetical protein